LDRWLARFLQNVPASDRLFLATFAEWRILRRVRNKAERGRLTDAGIKWAQSRIRAAAAFLAWLRERGKSLERASQPDVDLWLADRRVTTRYVVRDFLIWTNARKCSDRLGIPTRSGDEPAMLMDEKQRWREIEKLLVDRTLRNEVRLIALLSLVFAQHVSRVCRLIDALVDDRAGDVLITFGRDPIRMPPGLAVVLREQLRAARSNPKALRPDGKRWLFPVKNQHEAALAVFDFIEGWYNPHRRHTSIGNISPAEYERRSQAA
jgi:transposase InsO family protein